MRRLLTAVAAAVVLLATAGPAAAHPLGNFSVNHLTVVSISADRLDVRYVLDQAEIPTFRERGLSDAEVLRRKTAEVERRLRLTVDGRALTLEPAGAPRLSRPAGEGGLRTTRLELPLRARVRDARRVVIDDGTFPGRVGWKAVQVRPGDGTAVRTAAPATDPTDGLRRYPEDLLESPSDVTRAEFSVRPGDGTVDAGTGPVSRHGGDGRAADHGFAALLEGDRVLILLLLAAFGWGALHALSPGHGKAMVAAYLVGTRGSTRDALILGATVTVTHTAGVVALGFVALALSAWVLPEQLYPWLTLVSGLLVVGVGVAVLRGRVKKHAHDHEHGHHHHHHHHHRRSLLALGASAGLIPCPSALVVLLGAVAQHRIGLGLVLIVAFSAGLAATLTGLGVAVVHAGKALARLPVPGRLAAAVPALSAALIVVVGAALTAQAVPQVM
jgi:nickel/cobalt transporter (NicO) family protein